MNFTYYVYRLFDVEGNLLYVGCSKSPQKRIAEHALVAPWWRFFPGLKSILVKVPIEVHRELRTYCVANSIHMDALIAEWVVQGVAELKAPAA